MDKNKLKIIAGQVITESNLSTQSRLQLLKFVEKEAEEEQIMTLLLDGKIHKLDEQAQGVVRDRFNISEDKLNEAFEYLGSLSAVGGALQTDYNMCKKSKCYKKGIISKEKRKCLNMCHMVALQKGIGNLKGAMNRCNKAKNPDKCRERFEKNIARYQKQINKIKDKIKKMEG